LARKRKKRAWHINPIPILVLALAINVMFGLAYSPILALNRVRVEGALPSENNDINGWLQEWANKPLATVNARKIEALVLSLPEVEEAHFEHNAFGRGELKIKQREPVGKVEGADLVLAKDGGLFRWPEPLINVKVPRVTVPSSVFHIGLAVQGGTELGGLVLAAQELKKQWPDFEGVLELNQVGVLCLNRLQAGRVILGGFDQLEAKLQRLRQQLALHPDLSMTPVEINLVAPDRPAVRPLTLSNEPHREPLHPQGKLDHPGEPAVSGSRIHADASLGHRSKPTQSTRADGSQPASPSGSGAD
jgi:hypothetical protein